MNITIVVPCYNESIGVKHLYEQIVLCLSTSKHKFEILFVDDGSSDDTVSVIKGLQTRNNFEVTLISFSKNCGHQVALRAGYKEAKGDATICMDADLQHPPEILNQMIEEMENGFDIVTAIRDDNDERNSLKKLTSKYFYSIWSWLTDINLEPGSSDFRIVNRNALDAINSYQENFLFLRGLIPNLGFSTKKIKYKPRKRVIGESKYTLKKMLSLSKNGIMWGSIKPLRLSSILAFITAGLSIFFGVYSIYTFYFIDGVVKGWASLISIISLIGSLQLFAIGILGEYLGQLLQEVRKRPTYHIKEKHTIHGEK